MIILFFISLTNMTCYMILLIHSNNFIVQLLPVLSVVFQSYVQKMTNIRLKGANNREEALKFTFQTLWKLSRYQHSESIIPSNTISTRSLNKTLTKLRSHYNSEKVRLGCVMYNFSYTWSLCKHSSILLKSYQLLI